MNGNSVQDFSLRQDGNVSNLLASAAAENNQQAEKSFGLTGVKD